MPYKSLISVLSLTMLLAACGGRQGVYTEELQTMGPFPYPLGLAFLNRTLDQLIRVRLVAAVDGAGAQQEVVLDRVWLKKPGARRVYSVDQGRQLAVIHDDPTQPGISLIQNSGKRVEAFLPLADAFDTLVIAPSSQYGIAYFSGAAWEHSGIRNLNQIQVVRFGSPDALAYEPLALETGGLNPRGIDFLPPGSPEFSHVAAVRVDNGLVLVDLADPTAEPLWVRFTNSPGGTAIPAQVEFGPFFPDGGYLYVRLQGADDVLSVHLTRDTSGRLRRTVNFLNTPAGSSPTDLLVLSDPALFDKVFVVYGSSSIQGAALLDANSIQTDEKTFSFNYAGRYARRLTAVSSQGEKEFVLVHKSAHNSGDIMAFLVDPTGGDVETVYLQDGYHQVDGPGDGAYAMFFHEQMGSSSSPGMRVLRAMQPDGSSRWTHRIASYGLTDTPSVISFTENGQHMLGAFEHGNSTFLLDLEQGTYDTLLLDQPALAMGVIPGTDWAWFQHAHPLGALTLVPLYDYRRNVAVAIEGLVLLGLFDQH